MRAGWRMRGLASSWRPRWRCLQRSRSWTGVSGRLIQSSCKAMAGRTDSDQRDGVTEWGPSSAESGAPLTRAWWVATAGGAWGWRRGPMTRTPGPTGSSRTAGAVLYGNSCASSSGCWGCLGSGSWGSIARWTDPRRLCSPDSRSSWTCWTGTWPWSCSTRPKIASYMHRARSIYRIEGCRRGRWRGCRGIQWGNIRGLLFCLSCRWWRGWGCSCRINALVSGRWCGSRGRERRGWYYHPTH